MSFAAVANTAAADDAPSTTVKAWDLDLGKRVDVETLYERVRAAANELCREEAQRHYRTTRMSAPLGWQQRCMQEAVDGAISRSANPALAALHTQAPRIAAEF